MTEIKDIIIYEVGEDLEPITDEALSLCERSDEVDTVKGMKEARGIISEIKNVIRKKNIHSLSASAIGYKKRIFCVNFSDNEIKTFINPIITKAEGIVLSDETNPCLPNERYLVPRNNKINIMYTSPLGKIESREISGVAAAVIQQEIHMLDGILLCDIGLLIDEQWDNATQEEREEVINAYLDSLDIKQKEVEKVINEDEELKRISDATDFMIKAEAGEIEFEKIDPPITEKEKSDNEG